MPRANIDLSWLIGALTESPSAQQNPAYGATNPGQVDFTYEGDPVAAIKKYGTDSRFIRPTFSQKLFHPEESSQINNLNNQFSVRPLIARQNEDIARKIGAERVSRIRGTLPSQFATLDDIQTDLLTGGDLRPTSVAPEARTLTSSSMGLPKLQGQTDVARAQILDKNTQAELARADLANATLDVKTANEYAQAWKVDPLKIQSEYLELKGHLGRLPKAEELREYILANQIAEATKIVPQRQNLEAAQTANALHNEEQQTLLQPYTDAIQKNKAISGVVDSRVLSDRPLVSSRISPSGTIMPPSRDPLAVSPMAQTMESVKDISNQGGDTITDLKGNKYIIPKAPPSEIDPLTGSPITQKQHSGVAPRPPSDNSFKLTLGSSLGGEDLEFSKPTTYPSLSVKEYLQSKGLYIDKNGQIQGIPSYSQVGPYSTMEIPHSKLSESELAYIEKLINLAKAGKIRME